MGFFIAAPCSLKRRKTEASFCYYNLWKQLIPRSIRRWNVSDDFPEMTGDPIFTGPVRESRAAEFPHSLVCPNGQYTDFYFECRVQYPRQFVDDGARFKVSLTFDGKTDPNNPDTHVTTDGTALTVRFRSTALRGNVGKSVNICLSCTLLSCTLLFCNPVKKTFCQPDH